MDQKKTSMAPSFSRRSRICSRDRLLLAIFLTCLVTYFHPSILASVILPFIPNPTTQPQAHQQVELQEQQPNAYPIAGLSPNQEHAQAQQEQPPAFNAKTPSTSAKHSPSTSTTNDNNNNDNAATKIPLEAHIMSKCPDARDCLANLVVPAMSLISPLVDFKLYFIGAVNDVDDTVTCKHGPSECLGNSISLCAQDLYGATKPEISLGFTNCLLADYASVPDKSLVQDCALEHAVDFDKLNTCLSQDGWGEELLRKSVIESKEKNVTYSCTVRVQDDVWCVRDSGLWKECGEHGGSVVALVEEVRRRAAEGADKGKEKEKTKGKDEAKTVQVRTRFHDDRF